MFNTDESDDAIPQNVKMHQNMTGKVVSGVAWTASLYFCQMIMQLAFMAVLARLLSPAEFGIAAAAMIYVQFVRLFSEVGIAQAIVQMPQLDERLLRVGFAIVLALSLVLFGLSEALAPLVEAWFQQPGLTDVVRVLGIIFLVQAFSIVPQNLLYRRLRAKAVMFSLLLSIVVGTGLVAIPLAFNGWSYWALIAGMIAQEVAFAIVLLTQIKVPHLPAFTFFEARHLLTASVGFSVVRLLGFFASFGDNLIVGRYLSSEALGIYSRAFSLMNMPSAVYGAVADRVVFPAMARVQGEPARLAAAFSRGMALTATFGIPLTFFLFLVASDLINVLLGSQWQAAIAPFGILALAMYPRLASRVCASLLRSVGSVKILIALQGFLAFGTLLVCYVTYPYGLNAVAIGVSALQVFSYALFVAATFRTVPIGLWDFLQIHSHGFMLGLVVTLTSLLSMNFGDLYVETSVFRLLVTTLACVFAVLICAVCFPRVFVGPEGLAIARTIWMKAMDGFTANGGK